MNSLAILVALCGMMVVFSYTDLKSRIIRNRDLLVFAILAVLWNLSSDVIDFRDGFTLVSIGVCVSLWVFAFYFAEWQAEKAAKNEDGEEQAVGGFGGGDTKMLILMAFVFPPLLYLPVVLTGMLLSLIYFLPFIPKKTVGVPLAIPMTISFIGYAIFMWGSL